MKYEIQRYFVSVSNKIQFVLKIAKLHHRPWRLFARFYDAVLAWHSCIPIAVFITIRERVVGSPSPVGASDIRQECPALGAFACRFPPLPMPSSSTKILKISVYEALGDERASRPRPARSRAPGSSTSSTKTRRSSRASSAIRYSLAELDDFYDGAIPVRTEANNRFLPTCCILTQPYISVRSLRIACPTCSSTSSTSSPPFPVHPPPPPCQHPRRAHPQRPSRRRPLPSRQPPRHPSSFLPQVPALISILQRHSRDRITRGPASSFTTTTTLKSSPTPSTPPLPLLPSPLHEKTCRPTTPSVKATTGSRSSRRRAGALAGSSWAESSLSPPSSSVSLLA